MDGELLFCADFELHDGRNEKIEFRRGDTPESVAQRFCKAKGFNKKIYGLLVSHLKDKLEEVRSRMPREKVGNQKSPNFDLDGNLPLARHTHSEIMGTEASPNRKSRGTTSSIDLTDNRARVPNKGIAERRSNGLPQASIFMTENTLIAPAPSSRPREFQFRTMQLISEDEFGYFETPCSVDQRADVLKTMSVATMDAPGGPASELFLRPSYSVAEETKPNFYFGIKKKDRSNPKLKRSKSRSEILYEQALSQHQKKLLKAEQTAVLRQELEVEGISFTPHINRISTMIVEKKNCPMPHYERLFQNASTIEEKKAKCREMKQTLEDEKFDFRPKINSVSTLIDRETNSKKPELGESRFHQLYKESQVRVESTEAAREANNSQWTFQPEINPKSRAMVNSSGHSFKKRLDSSLEKLKILGLKHRERLAQPSVEPKPNLGRPLKSSWVPFVHQGREILRSP